MTDGRKFLPVLAILAALVPVEALAHAGERAFVMLLPTDYMIVGGASAVAISFLILAVLPPRLLDRVIGARVFLKLPAPQVSTVTSLVSFLAFVSLLATGVLGSRDPMANPLTLTIWTVFWIVLAMAHAVFGNLWSWMNPFSGPYRVLTAHGKKPPLTLPESLGCWPAVLGFFGFSWFLIASLAPADPERLAVAAVTYWVINFIAMLLFGEAVWLRRGEAFSLFFALMARLAPVAVSQGRWRLGVPGMRLLDQPQLGTSAAMFILLVLSGTSFDGLRETFAWLVFLGINPHWSFPAGPPLSAPTPSVLSSPG